MCAAITYVDKQRFLFSDVQRVCFSEIANHAKINGAKDVHLIVGIFFCIFLLDCPNAFCC